MDVRYIEPLLLGYGRMKKALFHPLDLRKWFVVGFTAFLAELTDCEGGNGGGKGGAGGGRNIDWDAVIYFPRRAQEWIIDNPQWAVAIAFGILLLLIVLTVITWLSSRGKFMFLDNVVHDRAQVVAPWHEFRSEGNSLFLWSIIFNLAALAAVGAFLVSCYQDIVVIYEQFGDPAALLRPAIGMALKLIGILLVIGFIDLLLVDFVVPVMYRSRIGVSAAWAAFLPLLGERLFSFIAYALFVLVLSIAIAIVVMAAVLLTCCIGLIPLIIPYIGTVALLPISYTMRAFSVEFLGQFGPQFRLFPGIDQGGTTGQVGSS